jgi:glycine hydroxymethyltransferase
MKYNWRVKDEVFELVEQERQRQTDTLQMIPSENYASLAVREAMGSVFGNKYAEGYPGKRYYQGNEFVDKLERLCQDRAKAVFGVAHVNVQPLSGGPANLAILRALKQSGADIQLSQALAMGGHLSMGQEASITWEYMNSVHYGLDSEGEINWQELEELAIQHRPKIIWSGGTGYTKVFKWERYAQIAEKVGAYFVADISHIGGLVAGGAHPSPVAFADVVMTTTHKTLRGPRGAMILVTEKGLAKDSDLANKIDRAVFPGIQGGPHMENVAGLAVALAEASTEEFKAYASQVVANAKVLASELKDKGYDLVGGGSENHMVWVDLSNKGVDGWAVAWGLEYAGIIANRQTVPWEKKSPYYPSGLRLGTPAVTTRGMKEAEMKVIAAWIDEVVNQVTQMSKQFPLLGGVDKASDQQARKEFKEQMKKDTGLASIRGKVGQLCSKFSI